MVTESDVMIRSLADRHPEDTGIVGFASFLGFAVIFMPMLGA
jgi:hypothetical protein